MNYKLLPLALIAAIPVAAQAASSPAIEGFATGMTIDEVVGGPAAACDELGVAFPNGSASTMGGTRETFGCASGRFEVDFTHHLSDSMSYLVSYEFCAGQAFDAMLSKVSQEFGVALAPELIAGKEVYGAALMGNVFLDLANGGYLTCPQNQYSLRLSDDGLVAADDAAYKLTEPGT